MDVDNDGVRDLFFASRRTTELTRLRAADGHVVWSKKFPGQQQSLSAFDVDDDGDYEILYTTSSPGRLNVVDHQGELVRSWETSDWKIGHSPVIIDVDGDGQREAIFGTRAHSLMLLRLDDFSERKRRGNWVQCGCHASAMDVDGDGRWDIFAGSGDDFALNGVLHRLRAETLDSVWQVETNDNASSADPVLVDLDNDGVVEIVKSVDNYKGDDNHASLSAYRIDGRRLWSVAGIAEEDSPNVADLDGDGQVEVVGMTFGGEVYCLNGRGELRWKRDLRPELGEGTHMYMTPILCDVNGDRQLEILAMTSGAYFETEAAQKASPPAILFALNAQGEILERLDLGSARFFGEAFVCQVDDDPYLEVVLSGSGGLDVVETRGYGPDSEYFQRRRSYQRLNVVPWAYEDTYFIERGDKVRVANQTDDLVLRRGAEGYAREGHFRTPLLTPPRACEFRRLCFSAQAPAGTRLSVDLLDADHRPLQRDVRSGADLHLAQPVRLVFRFSTSDGSLTPKLNSYSLAFELQPACSN